MALLLSLPGCADLVSVYPLATAQTATFDAGLLGEWSCMDKDCKGMAAIREDPGRKGCYDIVWIPAETNEETLRLSGRLVKVGDGLVFDLVTAKRTELTVPVHFFLMARKTADGMTVQWLDSEWLRQQATGPNGVAHIMMDNNPIVTAGSAQIHAFLARFGLDAKAVSGSLTFKRAKQA